MSGLRVSEEEKRREDGYREVNEMFRRVAGILNDLLECQEMGEMRRLELGDETGSYLLSRHLDAPTALFGGSCITIIKEST